MLSFDSKLTPEQRQQCLDILVRAIRSVQSPTLRDMCQSVIGMLSYHVHLEWRSPVEPVTMEAHILHSADMLSARPA